MKELSIEQKAKAYDEAIKRAKSAIKECGNNQGRIAMIESIFPELAESEDERIRKTLIEMFSNVGKKEWKDIPTEKIITWLEKQKDCEYIKKDWLEHIKQSWYKEGFIDGKYSNKTPKEWTINDTTTLNELIDFLENGTAKLQHDLTKYANWLKIQFTPFEKQGEQKPQRMISAEAKEAMYDKPAWSEDETSIAIKNPDAYKIGFADGEAHAKEEMQSSWSEEDKNFMYDTLSNLTELKDRYGEGYGNVGKCIDWLKSLKERYTWKPSDEQMHMLRRMITALPLGEVHNGLESLYNDLKKLKGE